MIEFTNIQLKGIHIHQIGNKLRDENFKISNKETSFLNTETESYLLKYFLTPFNSNEVYNFTHPTEIELNEAYLFAKRIFSSPESLYQASVDISKHLYSQSTHPKINGGELCVCLFENCIFNGISCDAIGFFKSEVKDVFLKFNSSNEGVNINHENGINVNKLDKGCLIFNLDNENGYKVCIVDSKSRDTQYWKNDFLNIKPASDDYHFTNDFLSMTKEYVTKHISNDFEINNTDQIDLLNRSVEYFKTNESFNKNSFEKEVFQDENVIKSFRDFNSLYKEDNNIKVLDNFEISTQAVKKQARVFKKVLKLDKNFHIYIHGKKDMIEKGIDSDGRKFYKIYYEKEQ